MQAGADKITATEDMRECAIFVPVAEGCRQLEHRRRTAGGLPQRPDPGRHVALFYPREQDNSRYRQWELEQAAANGFHIDRGWRVHTDGSRFWAHVVITAQRAPGGHLHGFIKVVRNEAR